MGLLDARGNPVSSQQFKKAPAPPTGPIGRWGGEQNRYAQLPGAGMVQFDLDALEIPDYRAMRDHYQVNASLAVLSFMQHQSDWHVVCDDQKIADECERQLRQVWTPLNRAMATANWAGYGPSIIEWENNPHEGKVEVHKVKDLYPEDARVHWKKEQVWTPPGYSAKVYQEVYDGINVVGSPYPIPVDNTFWYPLLMEHGNYYGRNLLKAAFTPWYFSTLIHLFANRYYERFGEPIVVGRAPFANDVQLPQADGTVKNMNGLEYMLTVMRDIRNRSVVALPDDKTIGSAGRFEFDYDLKYLESTMRGGDWESYLTRLDEEISIGLFTPILLLRTADVGSYNLGVGHMQMYLWMINAMNDDRALYINKYLLNRIVDVNYSPKAPRAKIAFRKLGNQNADIMNALITALISKGAIKPDIRELGEIAGLTLEEVEQVDGRLPEGPEAGPEELDETGPAGVGEPRATEEQITARVQAQIENAFAKGTFGPDFKIDMGFKRKMYTALESAGLNLPQTEVNRRTEAIYRTVNSWSQTAVGLGRDFYESPSEYMTYFGNILRKTVGEYFS